jgi:hemerythrin-like domain-containing protein
MPATSKKRSSKNRRTSTRRQNNRSGMDALSLLKKDHQNVRQLLARLESSAENGGSESTTLLRQIENELKVHTQIEEEIFYPAFKDAVEGKHDEHLYYEALEEHHVVDMVLPEIKSSSKNPDKFAAKAKVLKDLVEHHAEEEETEMFPKARKAMGTAELRELGQQMQARKQQLMGGTSAKRAA